MIVTRKALVCVCTCVIAVSAAISPAWPQANHPAGKIRKALQEAHATGKTHVRVRAATVVPMQARSLNDATDMSTILTAAVLNVATTIDPTEQVVWSWYKIRIGEILSGPAPRREHLASIVPHQLLPIKHDEFVIRDLGGTTQLEGVTIDYEDALPLRVNQSYLLLVSIDAEKVDDSAGDHTVDIGSIKFGLAGVYPIGSDGSLTTFGDSLIWQSIKDECSSTIVGVRACLGPHH